MMALFLIFSLNGFSQTIPVKTENRIITEQSGKGKAKVGRKPRKPVSKKKVHTSGPKRHNSNKSGNRVII